MGEFDAGAVLCLVRTRAYFCAAHLLAVSPALGLAAHVGSSPVLWRGCRTPARSASSGRRDGGSLQGSLAQVALAAAVLLKVGNAAAGYLAHLQR